METTLKVNLNNRTNRKKTNRHLIKYQLNRKENKIIKIKNKMKWNNNIFKMVNHYQYKMNSNHRNLNRK